MTSDAAILSSFSKESFRTRAKASISKFTQIQIQRFEKSHVDRFFIVMVGVFGQEFNSMIQSDPTFKLLKTRSRLIKQRSFLKKVFKSEPGYLGSRIQLIEDYLGQIH